MDQEKIQQGVRLLLEGIGEDPNREGLLETPMRVARMCEEIYRGLGQDAAEHLEKQFHVENNNIVMEKDIPFFLPVSTICFPFMGRPMWPIFPTEQWQDFPSWRGQ